MVADCTEDCVTAGGLFSCDSEETVLAWLMHMGFDSSAGELVWFMHKGFDDSTDKLVGSSAGFSLADALTSCTGMSLFRSGPKVFATAVEDFSMGDGTGDAACLGVFGVT